MFSRLRIVQWIYVDVAEFLIGRKRLHNFLCVVGSQSKNNLMQGGPFQLLKFILEWDLVTAIPNAVILLRIFLTMGVSVSSCERSFSKLSPFVDDIVAAKQSIDSLDRAWSN